MSHRRAVTISGSGCVVEILLGLDCGPIGGFDTDTVDLAFMAGTQWRSNFLLDLGYADHDKLAPRRPRLAFDDACRIV